MSGSHRCDKENFLPASERRELRGLHELHDDNVIDSDDRADILERIAALSLCGGHNEVGDIDAAVAQWEEELQGQAPIAKPKTPTARNSRYHEKLKFEHYSPKSKDKLENPKEIDGKVRQVLAGDVRIKDTTSNHLYVFSYKGASNAYKVGRGKHLRRPTQEQEKCYPGHKLHCFIECPNAVLFERVVHAELAQYRRTHECTKCQTVRHKEWFEAPLHDILDSVRAWSFYASMLYRYGLDIDGNHQRLPLHGFSTRPDRWRRWALEEARRWMDGSPSPTAVLPGISTPEEPKERDPVCESDSETASTSSTPASLLDTPGTTPATTPGTLDDEGEDYALSPTPAGRYSLPKPGEIADPDDDDDDGLDDRSEKSVVRALFNRSGPALSSEENELHSEATENVQSARRSSASPSDADFISDSSSTDISSSTWIDEKVREVLEQNIPLNSKPGTIYLTPVHPEKESYKIYYCGRGSPRKGGCYSKPEPYFEIQCKNTKVIQDLILAEFNDRTHRDTCGRHGCKTDHKNWINASGAAIEASLQAWAALLEMGYKSTQIPRAGFSRDTDRWRTWAEETVAKRKQKKARDAGRPSHVNRGSFEGPRPLSHVTTDSDFNQDPKGGGRGKAVKMIRRVSTFIKKSGKSTVHRASG